MSVYISACINIYKYVCVCLHLPVYICVYDVCVYVGMCVCVCVCVCAYMYIYTCVYEFYIHIIHMQLYTYTCGNKFNIIMTRRHSSLKNILSLCGCIFEKVVCERRVGDRTKTTTY